MISYGLFFIYILKIKAKNLHFERSIKFINPKLYNLYTIELTI
jgi:hypothetical protein